MSKLSTEERKALKDSDFALSGRRYPIDSEARARDALARASDDATPEEQETIRAAVRKRYPDMQVEGGKPLAASNDEPHGVGLLLALDTPYDPALTLGQGLPKTRGGLPCHHFWKESLVPGRLADARGTEWLITPKDIEDAVSDLKRALTLGHEPTIRDDHFKPTKSFGFVIDARKNARGGLDLLHQFMGDAERDEAMRRKTSIMLRPNYTDGKRNSFKWYTDHSAVVFNPRLPGLSDYQPALAASNGDVVDAVVLTLANQATPSQKGDIMPDLVKLRTALGDSAKDQSDDQVLALSAAAITALGTTRTKLRTALGDYAKDKDDDEVLALAGDVIPALDRDLTAKEQALEAANKQVLALQADGGGTVETPSPRELAMSAKLALKDVELAEQRQHITPKQATFLRERINQDKSLALSADDGGNSRVEDLIAFAALAEGHIPPNKPVGTPVKPLALSGEPEKKDGPMKPERKAELMELAGHPTPR